MTKFYWYTNLPWWTVGVGVTIPPNIDEENVVEALVEKVVLLVKRCGVSLLVTI